jgi:hypothetical protein
LTKSPKAPADAEGFRQNEITKNMTKTVVRLFLTVTNVTGTDLQLTARAAPGGFQGSANEQ